MPTGRVGRSPSTRSVTGSPPSSTSAISRSRCAQARLRRELGGLLDAAGHHAEHAPHLGERVAADLLDGAKRLALARLVVAEGVADAGRLDDHLRDGVRDDVVQLVRDPRALLGRRPLLCGGDLLAQLPGLGGARGERDAEEPGEREHGRRPEEVRGVVGREVLDHCGGNDDRAPADDSGSPQTAEHGVTAHGNAWAARRVLPAYDQNVILAEDSEGS